MRLASDRKRTIQYWLEEADLQRQRDQLQEQVTQLENSLKFEAGVRAGELILTALGGFGLGVLVVLSIVCRW